MKKTIDIENLILYLQSIGRDTSELEALVKEIREKRAVTK